MHKKFLIIIFFVCFAGCQKESNMPNIPNMDKNLEFTCVHEMDVNPPLDKEADAWFKKARRIEKGLDTGTEEDINALYAQAIAKGHWKALVNMARRYAYGDGVEQDTDKAIDMLEQGMQQNIGRAYSEMGDMLAKGLGVKRDVMAALSYHRKAADLGEPSSQELIGREFLSNRAYQPELGKKMLECAIAQGFGPAAFQMGLVYYDPDTPEFDAQKTLYYWQQGVKLGDRSCARSLYFAFKKYEEGDPPKSIDLKIPPDPERARRYWEILDKTYMTAGNIKFPDIDRMVPLPPKPLPAWKGPVGVVE